MYTFSLHSLTAFFGNMSYYFYMILFTKIDAFSSVDSGHRANRDIPFEFEVRYGHVTGHILTSYFCFSVNCFI